MGMKCSPQSSLTTCLQPGPGSWPESRGPGPGAVAGRWGHTPIYCTLCSSQQLHSSVRTGNLETCLRLLSLGAQANFFHPEKGTTPLHVAAKAGQTLQAELLVVYGADPGSPDVNGRTPIDYAR